MPVYRTGYLDKRGAEPSHWVKTDTRDRKWWNKDPEFAGGNYELTMTWHHNIPDNIWRDFWNIMLANNWSDEMAEFLYLTGMDDRPGSDYRISVIITKLNYLHEDFGRLAKGNGGAISDGYRKDLTDLTGVGTWLVGDANRLLTSNEMDVLRTRVSWQDWNIVEGPLNTLRPADPGDHFDDFSGLIPKERARLIKELHTYVKAQTDSGNVQVKGLLSVLNGFRALRNLRVIPFSLDIWEKDADSKGRIPKVPINSVPRETWRTKTPS